MATITILDILVVLILLLIPAYLFIKRMQEDKEEAQRTELIKQREDAFKESIGKLYANSSTVESITELADFILAHPYINQVPPTKDLATSVLCRKIFFSMHLGNKTQKSVSYHHWTATFSHTEDKDCLTIHNFLFGKRLTIEFRVTSINVIRYYVRIESSQIKYRYTLRSLDAVKKWIEWTTNTEVTTTKKLPS